MLIAVVIATVAQLSVSSAGQAADKAASSVAHAGQMLYDSTGHRVATVNRVTPNGDALVIANGHLVTVPASTLSQSNGKLQTSLTRAEINRAV
jgi:hypothetical protein